MKPRKKTSETLRSVALFLTLALGRVASKAQIVVITSVVGVSQLTSLKPGEIYRPSPLYRCQAQGV